MSKSGINIELPRVELNGLFKDLNRYNKRKIDQIANEVEAGSFTILSDAKGIVPVKTGRLRSSGNTKFNKSKLTGVVGFETNYAAKVEFKNKAYLRPSYNKNIQGIIDRIRILLNRK